MLTTIVIMIHAAVCLVLIFTVLLQAGKGAEMGAAFGGSSKTVFGPRGAAGPLAKITIAAAALFMLTSLYLTYASNRPNVPETQNVPPPVTGKPVTGKPAPAGQATPTAPSQPSGPVEAPGPIAPVTGGGEASTPATPAGGGSSGGAQTPAPVAPPGGPK